MPENPSEIKHWPDPKDYGLPYVEVTPLRPVAQEEVVQEQPKIEPVIDPVVEVTPLVTEVESETKIDTKEESIPEPISESTEVKSEPVQVEASAPKSEEVKTQIKEEKKSNSWVAIVLILAVMIISVIVWQLMSQGNEPQINENATAELETPISKPQAAQPAVENTPTEEIQSSENQDSIPKSNSSLEEPVETQQTGTTIDRTGAETLIRVESKSDRPQYFIVVGSLPNEKMAISESAQYFDRASSVYLILPYEDVKNYRLAIGTYTSFRKASEELDLIKDQYTEAIWILKY